MEVTLTLRNGCSPGPRSLEIIGLILSQFENTVPLKPVLVGVGIVSHDITVHEQTQLNRDCFFRF